MDRVADAALIIAGIIMILFVTGALTAVVVWMWQNAADKLACRRTNGTVVQIEHGEWHCVGATPEAK